MALGQVRAAALGVMAALCAGLVDCSEKRGVVMTKTLVLCDDLRHLNISWW